LVAGQNQKFFSSVGAPPDLKWEVGKLIKSKKYKIKKSALHWCKSAADFFFCGEWDYPDGFKTIP
jgi:hypothetical protein